MVKRQHAEAVSAFSRGLSRVLGRLDGGRATVFRESLAAARIGQQADELHRRADSVRFRFGVDPPDASAARMLAQVFPALWDKRGVLLDWASRSGDEALRERVRTDLLELASIWADSRVRGSSADAKLSERTAALALLEEAEATCGRSTSLRRQVRAIRRDLGRADDSDAGDDPPPADAWERYDLGRFYLRSGRFLEAMDQFDRASRERPQDFWPSFYQGVCAYHLERFDDAATAFRVCEALSPSSAECIFNHALAQEARGERALAWDAYSRAIVIDARLSAARLNRGILSFQRGDDDAAIADFDEAIRSTDDPSIRLRAQESREIAARRIGRRLPPDAGPARR
jgi:tetratricopeptide (TPR) repeat protein